MLEAVELPAGIAHLDTGLADVDGDDFAHVDGDFVSVAGVEMRGAQPVLSLVTKQARGLAIESLRLNSKTRMTPGGGGESRELMSGGGVMLNPQALCSRPRMAEQSVSLRFWWP